jgi:AraC-like DNA-binding protein
LTSDARAEHEDPPQTLQEWLPHRALRPYVTCVWAQRVSARSDAYRHRTAPDGSVELVCPAGGPASVVGPRTTPSEQLLAPGAAVVGVRFRPGAAPAILGLPASELTGSTIGADELWGSSTAELAERVAGSTSPPAAASALETAVLSRLAEARPLDELVAEVVRRVHVGGAQGQQIGIEPQAEALTRARELDLDLVEVAAGAHSMAEVAASLHVSMRQLRRRCEAAVGLGPKELQRIARFQRFLLLAEHRRSQPGVTLATLALGVGYADQAHLARESVRLTGSPPRELLLAAARHCHGVHDHSASRSQLFGTPCGRGPRPPPGSDTADFFKIAAAPPR